jgi:hypothetical protein
VDIAASTDGYDTVSNDTGPVSSDRLIVSAMAERSTNPSQVDSILDEGVIAPERDLDPLDFDGRTVVSLYVPLICVLLAGLA